MLALPGPPQPRLCPFACCVAQAGGGAEGGASEFAGGWFGFPGGGGDWGGWGWEDLAGWGGGGAEDGGGVVGGSGGFGEALGQGSDVGVDVVQAGFEGVQAGFQAEDAEGHGEEGEAGEDGGHDHEELEPPGHPVREGEGQGHGGAWVRYGAAAPVQCGAVAPVACGAAAPGGERGVGGADMGSGGCGYTVGDQFAEFCVQVCVAGHDVIVGAVADGEFGAGGVGDGAAGFADDEEPGRTVPGF